MNKYSKIKLVNNYHHTKKSRSIDFSDLTTFPKIITKPIEPKPKTHKSRTNLEQQEQDQESKEQNQEVKDQNQEDNEQNQDPKNGDDGFFPNLKLTRNNSVSSNTSTSHRLNRFETQTNSSSTAVTLEDAVRRAFSVRRSSSVSERYCRIHDQCVTLSSPLYEDNNDNFEGENYVRFNGRSMGKKKKQSKILKACKRFFGL